MGPITGELAECIGLWLAEGDNKTNAEITFTNNCLELIDLFHNILSSYFKMPDNKIRMYIYSTDGKGLSLPYKNVVIKNYIHKRASKPYIIFRIASRELVKRWKALVRIALDDQRLYPEILRGFFAGEGNVKGGKRGVRVLRISQRYQKKYIDDLLNEFGINFNFRAKNRNYVISGKSNWDIFAKFKLADLHPDKKERFWRLYNSYKEEHYKKGHLKKGILCVLNKPQTTKELSIQFKRSFARIQDVLIDLKKNRKIQNFRIGSVDYWTNNLDSVIISKLKNRYLLLLDIPRQTFEFSNRLSVCWKNAYKRLKELEKLGLVGLNIDKKWIKQTNKKKKIVII